MWGIYQKPQSMTISEFMEQSKKNKEKSKMEEEPYFFVEAMIEGVKQTKSRKQLKEVKNVFTKTLYTCVSFLTLTSPVSAQTQSQFALPPEIGSGIVTIQLIMLGLVGGIATICLMLAGLMRLLNMDTKAKEWTKQIIYGLLQVLVAPVVIWLIVTIIKTLLDPLDPLTNPASSGLY